MNKQYLKHLFKYKNKVLRNKQFPTCTVLKKKNAHPSIDTLFNSIIYNINDWIKKDANAPRVNIIQLDGTTKYLK